MPDDSQGGPEQNAKGKTSSYSEPAACPPTVWLVLYLSPKKRGSMEEQLIALARRLRHDGIGLTCVFAAEPAAWLDEALRREGAAWRALELERPFAAAAQLAGWLAEARPQLVHLHFIRAYSPIVAAAKLSGATVLLHDHVTLTRPDESIARDAYKRVRGAVLNGMVDLRLPVSREVARSVVEIEHVAPERVEVVPNGIALERFARADGGAVRRELGLGRRPVIACVSRLSAEKGVESAIRMMPLVARSAVLLLAGAGPMEAPWRALAGELGVEEAVRFLGVRDDVERVLAAADVVVVPSHWDEAFGLAAVEGMAAGRPVVVTESGALPELVGEAGVVVPRRDPAALAGAVTRLLDDPLLSARLGRAAQKRAQARFGMEAWVSRVVEIYRHACPALTVERAA